MHNDLRSTAVKSWRDVRNAVVSLFVTSDRLCIYFVYQAVKLAVFSKKISKSFQVWKTELCG